MSDNPVLYPMTESQCKLSCKWLLVQKLPDYQVRRKMFNPDEMDKAVDLAIKWATE